ncbi:MAG TPA: hypothetical protein VF306_00900 [Pirellulales bacterium]
MFSVFLLAADPEKLRERLACDAEMVSEIAAEMKRQGASQEEIHRICRRVGEVRCLQWPSPGDQLSVDALVWMLDYAAEPIDMARIQGIRYTSMVDEVPLLDTMVSDPGPLPLPDVRELQCEIGFVGPRQMRELADAGPPPCLNPHLDVGTELVEVFESLADDGLGLYTILDGAKLRRR